MLKVVLIDDEPLVIEGLKLMVNWEACGFKVSGTAQDGEAGFDLIEHVNPDLAFVDIRMPGLDGLTLIQKCSNLSHCQTKFVILSGYSDFDDVKRALDYHCLTYLIKPFDSDEVEMVLRKFVSDMKQEEIAKQRQCQQIEFVMEGTLRRLILGEHKPRLIQRLSFMMGFKTGMALNLVLFKNEADVKLFKELIPSEWVDYNVVIGLNDQDSLWLYFGEDVDLCQWRQWMDGIHGKTPEMKKIQTIVGAPIEQVEDLYKAFQSLNHASAMIFYEPKSAYYFESDIQKEQDDFMILRSQLDLAEWIERIKKRSPSELDQSMINMIKKIQGYRLKPHLLKLELTRFFIGLIEGLDLDEQSTFGQSLNTTPSFKALSSALAKELKALYEHYHGTHLEGVERVKHYIDQYYAENLKLKDIANLFGFNPVYLGQIFQKTYGHKFNEYLMTKRIEKARNLLSGGQQSVKAIAHDLGFNHPDYFVQCFKQATGVSPLEYRKKRLSNK